MRVVLPSGAKGRRGATVVESAVVLNLALLMILGLFEFGRLMMVWHLLDNAARVAAREAASGTYDKTAAEIQGSARRMLLGEQFDGPPTISVYRADHQGNNVGAWDTAAFGEGIAVKIDVRYRPLLPTLGILPSTYRLSARSVMRSEGD